MELVNVQATPLQVSEETEFYFILA